MRLFSLFLILKASTLTDATVYCNMVITCSNFTFPDEGADVVRELCFSYGGYGPAEAVAILDNGTEVIVPNGGFAETHYFKNDLDGLTTRVAWDEEIMEGETQPCVADVNGENCTSCTICEDGLSWSADCTNLEQGRNVDCETLRPFFPFMSTYEYMGTMAPSDGGTSSSTASSTSAGEPDDDLATEEPAASPVPEDSTTSGPTVSATASLQKGRPAAKGGVIFILALTSALVPAW